MGCLVGLASLLSDILCWASRIHFLIKPGPLTLTAAWEASRESSFAQVRKPRRAGLREQFKALGVSLPQLLKLPPLDSERVQPSHAASSLQSPMAGLPAPSGSLWGRRGSACGCSGPSAPGRAPAVTVEPGRGQPVTPVTAGASAARGPVSHRLSLRTGKAAEGPGRGSVSQQACAKHVFTLWFSSRQQCQKTQFTVCLL